MSPIAQAQLATWRAKALEGTLSLEEMKEAIKLLRESRQSTAYTKDATTKKKAIAEIPHADDLLSELEGL